MTYDPQRQLTDFGSATFETLRPVQAAALASMHAHPSDAGDPGIELPTGSGKTLIGLLLAHEAMAASGSAVYLAPTRQLANQVAEESGLLGLPAEVFEAPLNEVPTAQVRRVNRGRSLGIFNYWAYFSEADLVDPPSLLILDDAHLAEGAIAGRYSVVLTRELHREQFDNLIALIAAQSPGYPVVDDLVADRQEVSRVVQLLTFGDIARLLPRARTELEGAADADRAVRYPLRRIGDQLGRCLWLIEQDAITIRPLRFPLMSEPRFGEAGRRVYMSATIGDLHDLRRRLGTGAIRRLDVQGADDDAVPGRRHIVIFDADVDPATRQQIRARLSAATPRRVWFCRSFREAAATRDERAAAGGRAKILDRDGSALAWFRRSSNGDLVLASRYDGMDFAEDDARLAFFPSAPYGTDPFDEFMAANFPRSGFLTHRLAERLTQALGRMTRSDQDWAVCVIESQDFARLLARGDILAMLPPTIAAEIEDAWDRAEASVDETVRAAEAILSEVEPVPDVGDWRRPTRAPSLWEPAWADYEAVFGDSLSAGVYDSAIAYASRLIAALGDHSVRPWWLYLRAWAEALSAADDQHLDRHDAALADLGSAIRAAGPTTWFGRVAAMTNRLRGPRRAETEDVAPRTAAHPIEDFVVSKTDAQIERVTRNVTQDLRSRDHDRICRAWTEIGRVLGFHSSQPGGGGATDSRWEGMTGTYVFEAKIEHAPGTKIARREVNQLLGQIEEERPSGRPTFGAFLTHMTEYAPDVGAISEGLVILTLDAAETIWDRTSSAIQEVAASRRAGHIPPNVSPPPSWLERLFTRRRGQAMSPDDVVNEWTRGTRRGMQR